MAKSRRGKRRSTFVYVSPATKKKITKLAKFYPALEKSKGQARITSSQAALVRRAEKRLAHTESIRPITEKQAKLLKKRGAGKTVVGGGVRAMYLRETASNARVRINKDGTVITSNGATFEYHEAEADPDTLAALAEELLERDEIASVYLWTSRGRANEGFQDAEEFAEELDKRFTQYHHVTNFIVGLVARRRIKPKNG